MDYILDTHTLLWHMFDSGKLTSKVKNVLSDNTQFNKYISMATLWEISIKNRIGKLPLPHGVTGIFSAVESYGFSIVGINHQCVDEYNKLPLIHRDPFDGMIVATAKVGGMTIITADENMQKYDVACVW